jgi:hypothetical protein
MDETPGGAGFDEFVDDEIEGVIDDQTPLWAAIRTVKEGLSANEGLRLSRESGIGIRRQDWLTLVREVRTAIEAGTIETMQPLETRPFATEATPLHTVTATGFIQYIDVWVRDRETGEVRIRPYAIHTDELLVRGDAVATAIDRMQRYEDLYGERILGAVYAATHVLIPKGK